MLTQGVICDYLSQGQTFSPQAHFSPSLKDLFIQTKHNAEANTQGRALKDLPQQFIFDQLCLTSMIVINSLSFKSHLSKWHIYA